MDDLNRGVRFGNHIFSAVFSYIREGLEYDVSFPEESESTCNQCPQIVEANFDPVYRCCTYYPRLANFSVGLALEDPQTSSKIEQQIAYGAFLPEGMQHTPLQYKLALTQNFSKDFGKDAAVKCPFLVESSRNCGLYFYRNSVCSTFFCKSSGLASEFWDSFQSLLGQYETAISQWCMNELGLDTTSYFKRFDDLSLELENVSREDARGFSEYALDRLWGSHGANKKKFFLECASLVRSNKDKLADIARSVEVLGPNRYEESFYKSLPSDLKKEVDKEGPISGRAVPLDDLLYRFEKIARDFKLSKIN